MKVHVGRLRLTFLFDIDLQDVQIKDGQDDSLLDVERLSVDLSFASLLHGEIDVEGIELTRAAVNTKSMIAGVEIKGSIGRFFVNSHGIEIPQEMVTVNTALLFGCRRGHRSDRFYDGRHDRQFASELENLPWASESGTHPGTVQHAGRQYDHFGWNPYGSPAERSHRLRTSLVHGGNFRLARRFAILRPAIRENRRRTGCQPYRTSGHRPRHRQYHIRRKRLGAFTGFARNAHERKKAVWKSVR